MFKQCGSFTVHVLIEIEIKNRKHCRCDCP